MRLLLGLAGIAAALVATAPVVAQAKHDRCDSYTRKTMASDLTSTGSARDAARPAMVALLGGPKAGAGVIAIVDGASRVNAARSYQFYYDQCMAGQP